MIPENETIGGRKGKSMFRKVFLPILLATFSGCVHTQTTTSAFRRSAHRDADSAFWGTVKKTDGTEYFRMGSLLIMKRDGRSK